MALGTNIQWCDDTVNPSTGCDGCELWGPKNKICYAGNLHELRLSKSVPSMYSENFQDVRLAPGRMRKAAGWHDLTGLPRLNKPWLDGYPRMIFVGDMSDFMSRALTDEYVEQEIVGAIRSPQGQKHFWLLLTKQPRRLAEFAGRIGGLPDNCMAMTSVTNQHTADTRIPDLLKVECKWRGVSAEPLWEEVDLTRIPIQGTSVTMNVLRRASVFAPGIHWVIVGGESEQKGAPQTTRFKLDWAHSLIEQCRAAEVPIFIKQLGTAWSKERYIPSDKKGGDMADWPEELRVREMPRLSMRAAEKAS
jgi:protein gp37